MRANIGKGLVSGMIGGLVASWVMERFQEMLPKIRQKAEEAQPAIGRALDWPQGHPQEQEGGDPATVRAAAAISSKVLNHELQPGEKPGAGEAVHYAFGALCGAVYGAIAEYVPAARAGGGSGFGMVLWALSDEVGVPLVGLSKTPDQYPVGVHASALASHIVYGMSTELVRAILRSGALAR